MVQLKVIDANERILQECAAFQIEEQGILTKNKEGEQIGFFPFERFHRIVRKKSPHGQENQESQPSNQNTPRSQPKPKDQSQSQGQSQPQNSNQR